MRGVQDAGARIRNRWMGGEFNWSSQHLDDEVLQCRDGNGEGQTGRVGLRCVRLVGRRQRGVRSRNGSGRRSRGGCRVRMPLCPVACRRPWVVVGSVRPVVCRRSAWRPDRARYLSLAEREEIAILRAQGAGVRDIARRLRRAPSTVSRELRSQRGDSERRSGVSGVDCAVAQRPTCHAPEDRQAGRERSAEELRGGCAKLS